MTAMLEANLASFGEKKDISFLQKAFACDVVYQTPERLHATAQTADGCEDHRGLPGRASRPDKYGTTS